MSRTLPPVPTPTFTVYGLDSSFHGDRAVDVWNRLGDGQTDPLWHVALAHTSDNGRFAVVITDGKLIAPSHTDASSRHETALGDVARAALLGLISTADTATSTSGGAVPSMAMVNTLADAVGEEPWQSTVLDVDGEARSFWIYRAGDHVAACADVGPVAVGFYGRHADLLISTAALVRVNETLQAYSLPQIG
jgi:hypothetical protein